MSQVGREGRLTLASDRAAERIAASIVRVVAKGCQASAGTSILCRLTTNCRPKQLVVQRQFVTQARVSLAPKGPHTKAQGNALGTGRGRNGSPERAYQMAKPPVLAAPVAPLQGCWIVFGSTTQGVALG